MDLKNKGLINIVFYLFLYLLAGTLTTYIVAYAVAKSNNYEFSIFLEQMNSSTYNDIELFNKANFAATLANFIVYFILFIVLIIINRDTLIAEFKKIGNKVISFIIFAIFGFIILYGTSYIINYLYNLYNIGVSQNQNSIENYILHGNAILTFITVVIFAPLVEEIIYRYSIFSLIKNKILAYVVTIICFALPHMLSTNSSISEWLLLMIPYLLSGFILALIYDSSKNIYASIVAHCLNNLLAFIIILI